MREIKFRAWDAIQKEMVLPEKCMPFTMITPYGLFRLDPFRRPDNYQKIDRQYVLMQFTGLHDKNWVEIYEGDIITCNNKDAVMGIKWPHKGIVEYVSFRYAINVGRQNIDDEQDYCAWFQYVENIEVIGNIYTHPHLLTSPTPQ